MSSQCPVYSYKIMKTTEKVMTQKTTASMIALMNNTAETVCSPTSSCT